MGDRLLLACATPLVAAAMDDAEAEALARTLKAVADPNRVKILHRLVSAAPEGVCVCDLTEPLGIAQPSVSYHLRILRQAGLIERRRERSFAYFSVRAEALHRLAALLDPTSREVAA
ncbi:MAG: ArsR/SmtB family transcription factor [Gaiellales bacterium]